MNADLLPSRREFVDGLKTAAILAAAHQAAGATRTEVKAVAFDAFPILDPRPVFVLVERALSLDTFGLARRMGQMPRLLRRDGGERIQATSRAWQRIRSIKSPSAAEPISPRSCPIRVRCCFHKAP